MKLLADDTAALLALKWLVHTNPWDVTPTFEPLEHWQMFSVNFYKAFP